MTKDEVVKAVESLARQNGAFYGFETITEPKMNKKSRATGLPFEGGKVTCHSTFSAMLGVSYENAVNNERERNGEERDFSAMKPFGKHYVDGSKWLMAADKDESRFYVAMDKVGGVKKTWLCDGKEMTPEAVADLKENFLPKPSASKIKGEWRTYGVESIVAIH